MPSFDEDDDDSYYENEYYEDDDLEDSETVPCPACGSEVYEDAEQCSICGEYIIHNSGINPLWKNTAWFLLAGSAVLVALYLLSAVFGA